MGESFGAYSLDGDDAVIGSVSSVNIACGFHAGDPHVMGLTVRLAKEHGVGIGAHPGLPDLLGFGRRDMACSPEEIADYLTYQIGALQAFCIAQGVALRHVKPHGALYNRAANDERLVRVMAQAVARIDRSLFLVGLAGRKNHRMAAIAAEAGVNMVFEAFPDRAYTPEGTLVARNLSDAVILDPETAAARAVRMAIDRTVEAVDGTVVPLTAQTLCIHGDHPQGAFLAVAIRERLEAAGVAVRPMQPVCDVP
jgi:Uncharacterized proteins, homologs of lactam utilization protein B